MDCYANLVFLVFLDCIAMKKNIEQKKIHPKVLKQLSPIQTKSITITTSKLKVLVSFEILQLEINNPQKYATTQPTISFFQKIKIKFNS
jgi:hypothetical protein